MKPNTIKLPTGVFSHQVAHGLEFTLEGLDRRLKIDRECGYIGQVIVPATIPAEITAGQIAAVFRENSMRAVVCGFMPGDGPDPMSNSGYQEACEAFLRQISMARDLVTAEVGPAFMFGPWQTWHGKISPEVENNPELRDRWMEFCAHQAGDMSITLGAEGLNATEQPGYHGDNDPFHEIMAYAMGHRRIRLHVDMGHLVSRLGMAGAIHFINKFHDYIVFFEFGNAGRWPLDVAGPINIPAICGAIKALPDNALVGVEPFDPEGTIKPLKLEALCPTWVPGPEALLRDARFLTGLGVMAPNRLSC